MKWFIYLPFAAVAILLGSLFVIALPDAVERAKVGYDRAHASACEALQAAPTNPVLGRIPVDAPDFELPNFTGQLVKLSALRGSVVLVNFWATWCQTCAVEIPSMEQLAVKMQGKPFRMLAVSIDEDWPVVREFFPKGTPLEVLLDKHKTTPPRYGTEKFPESFIVDKEGKIRYYVISDRDWNQPDIASCLDSLVD